MDQNYYSDAMKYWHGRIDSSDDYEAFRWHQWVEPLDLNRDNIPFEGKVGFAFIGFQSEQGVKRNRGRVGTALAPEFIRNQMSNLPCTFSPDVKMFDAGDIVCDELSLEEGQMQLASAVERILSLHLFPIVLGGGHETTFGHFQGQLNKLEQSSDAPDLAIINFDAHFDLRPYNNGCSSGSMFLQMADICKHKNMPYCYLPIGIQQHSNTISLFKTAKELGVDYILAKEVQRGNVPYILEKIDSFLYERKNGYLTVCTDVFSSSFAPGVSATQSLGLDPEVVLPIIKHILRTRKIRGFDICEVSPRFDQDNTTANLAAVIIFSVVNTICQCNNLCYSL